MKSDDEDNSILLEVPPNVNWGDIMFNSEDPLYYFLERHYKLKGITDLINKENDKQQTISLVNKNVKGFDNRKDPDSFTIDITDDNYEYMVNTKKPKNHLSHFKLFKSLYYDNKGSENCYDKDEQVFEALELLKNKLRRLGVWYDNYYKKKLDNKSQKIIQALRKKGGNDIHNLYCKRDNKNICYKDYWDTFASMMDYELILRLVCQSEYNFKTNKNVYLITGNAHSRNLVNCIESTR